MPCPAEVLRQVPLFALLDDEEAAVLAAQVEIREFQRRQRIYKIGDPGDRAYVLISGEVEVKTIDEDHQEVCCKDNGQHGKSKERKIGKKAGVSC